jgi:glycosyltransferase involved in cell wall biosynthesis
VPAQPLRVLFFVEGFTDIRFVVGLSEICDLTMVVPARAYEESALRTRVAASRARVTVHAMEGGRVAFQLRSLAHLWRIAGNFDVMLSQEMLRGSLNATLIGRMRGVPVVATVSMPAVEYFRCRRERGRIGRAEAWAGEAIIRTLLAVNGRLTTACLALGPYLMDVVARSCKRVEPGYYYGVDTQVFRPADAAERAALRQRLSLPADKFLIVLASRISHEKDPETVLEAVARARANGLDALLLNLGGGYQEFLDLAASMHISDARQWVLGRPAAHPMHELADYYRAADALVQGSLAEGLGLSPLEALACETPVVATAVGGMAAHLGHYASLTPRRDADAMACALLAIAADPTGAHRQASRGREYVCREWSRDKAFGELRRSLTRAARRRAPELARGEAAA